jgi:hypothetical protein
MGDPFLQAGARVHLGFQTLVCGFQFGGALAGSLFQFSLESPDLLLRPVALGDIGYGGTNLREIPFDIFYRDTFQVGRKESAIFFPKLQFTAFERGALKNFEAVRAERFQRIRHNKQANGLVD